MWASRLFDAQGRLSAAQSSEARLLRGSLRHYQILREGSMKLLLAGLLLWSTVGVQAQAGATPAQQSPPAAHRAGPSIVDAGDYI